MTIQLTFTIDLQSDYHVGSGQRLGPVVDAALLRDHDQVPILRGTAVAGLLRDGLRDLFALPVAKQIPLQKEAEIRLFGDAAHPKRWVYSSARPVTSVDRNLETTRWGARNVTRVRINPRTRRADPQKLFTQEEGDGRLQFHFTAACEGATIVDKRDAALLIAASRMVRHLGSARRRGRGACRLYLEKASGFLDADEGELTKAALEKFKQYWLLQSQFSTEQVVTAMISAAEVPQADGGRLRFRVIARAVEPVIIASRSETANAFETLPMLTGTAVMGALATRAARRLHMRGKSSPEFIRFFLRGGLSVSHLLPAKYRPDVDQLSPTIPAPASFLECENYPSFRSRGVTHAHHNSLNGFKKSCTAPQGNDECSGKLKRLSSFLELYEAGYAYNPLEREEAHIRMAYDTQRVEEGALYEYMALEAGQWFVGEFNCDKAYWDRVQTLTDLSTTEVCELRLGKATRRGYGLVRLMLLPLTEEEEHSLTFIPASFGERVNPAENETLTCSILLLTDTIMLDRWGSFYSGFAPEWLADVLGLAPNQIEVHTQFVNQREVDGFHTHRRMPRWRELTIAAGSVAKITIHGVNNQVATQMAALEKWGIGRRRQDGYGRIAFNHPIFDQVPDFDISLLPDADEDERVGQLYPREQAAHALQAENRFRKDWKATLDQHQTDNNQLWQEELIKGPYEPLARLIYLYRYRTLNQLMAWLAESGKDDNKHMVIGQHQHLWGSKKLLGRNQEPRLNKHALQEIRELIDKLRNEPAAHQAIGLELLASRLSENVANAR